MCALGGAIYAQYQMYIGPDTIAGLGVSLNIVFAVIAGGMWVMLGPTVGAVFTQVLSEGLRVAIQGSATLQKICSARAALALDTMIYGLLLVLFIIYMPKGILGTLLEWWAKRNPASGATTPSRRRRPEGGDFATSIRLDVLVECHADAGSVRRETVRAARRRAPHRRACGHEIGVFHWQGEFYAYQNLCVHQGGPACEGIIMHKVEDVLGPDRTWHGAEVRRRGAFRLPVARL